MMDSAISFTRASVFRPGLYNSAVAERGVITEFLGALMEPLGALVDPPLGGLEESAADCSFWGGEKDGCGAMKEFLGIAKVGLSPDAIKTLSSGHWPFVLVAVPISI